MKSEELCVVTTNEPFQVRVCVLSLKALVSFLSLLSFLSLTGSVV